MPLNMTREEKILGQENFQRVADELTRRDFMKSLLVTGAVNDPRVLVHEPAKWVARLRATDPDADPRHLLFRVELGEGAHAGPNGRFTHLDYESEILAWILTQFP